ncbi:MAG: hypothetical protein KKC10_08000, partial [Alphaproteobacteria bacterium]|nr:hypothetical protein [Alphaproteobacteria bacterium]
MSATQLGQILGILAALFGLFQAARTLYQNFRERDSALLEWGKQVITMMAMMEELFAPYLNDSDRQKAAFKASLRAGELLDHGRL